MHRHDDQWLQAREMSWKQFGKRITFYLPGMFSYHGLKGKYPAVSITGGDCALQCDHCRGSILTPMISATSSESLIKRAHRLAEKGNYGILISGGCDQEGRLPWEDIIPAIREIKEKTDLHISIHSGLVDDGTALRLKEAGVDQALIDVIGDDDTFQRIYHVPFGISRIQDTLESLQRAEIPMIPHIVCGLHFGEMKGEERAVEIISRFDVEQVVIVALMTIRGTPLSGVEPPGAKEVAQIILKARLSIPDAPLSLGCARRRGDSLLELLAIDAGINCMALPSDEAIRHAENYGLEIRYQMTCCSVAMDLSRDEW